MPYILKFWPLLGLEASKTHGFCGFKHVVVLGVFVDVRT